LDFSDKGEAFVEARFLTPLLAHLGYETHRDYEVLRHGDNGSTFKLHYPPVEMGAQRVKHYNPDYVPTIRKKMFWIVEAKSPKDVAFPFDAKYLVQGLQYCIHPEIQAKYLVVTNGIHTAVYDAHGSVFFGKEIYEPIFSFKSSELAVRWGEIFSLLSVDKLRTRIEIDLKAMLDKLCLSSLDKSYPRRLLQQIGASAGENAQRIEYHASRLFIEDMEKSQQAWCDDMEKLSSSQIYERMTVPLRAGVWVEGTYFVVKSLAECVPADEVFRKLTFDFDRQSIFRKLQTFMALCALYRRMDDDALKHRCRSFFDHYKDAELPLLNQVECALLRLVRKVCVLSYYPPLRQRLQQELSTAPELIRFVNPPTAFALMYPFELQQNQLMFNNINKLADEELQRHLTQILQAEAKIEHDFWVARAKLTDSERELGGLEGYGVGGKHYAFKNILITHSLEPAS